MNGVPTSLKQTLSHMCDEGAEVISSLSLFPQSAPNISHISSMLFKSTSHGTDAKNC